MFSLTHPLRLVEVLITRREKKKSKNLGIIWEQHLLPFVTAVAMENARNALKMH